MLARLFLLGLGTHAELDIEIPDPRGWVEIAGRSGSGKTTLLEGAVFALLGLGLDGAPFALEAIGAGSTKASATLTTAVGTEIHRSVTTGRSWSRRMTKAGQDTHFASDAELLGQLGPVGKAPDVARVVMVPMAWRALLERDLGRPLRDLLARILPDSDPRPKVAEAMKALGFELRQTDPVSEQGAAGAVTIANRALAEAQGAVDALRASKPAEAPEGPTAEAVAQARAVLAAADAWKAHDTAMGRHADLRAARARQVAARDAWRARRAELGDRPAQEPGALQAHRANVERLARALDAAQREETGSARALSNAQLARDHAAGAFRLARDQGDTCPTCKRPGWEDAAAALQRATADGLAKKQALDGAEAVHAAAIEKVEQARAELEATKEAAADIEAAAQTAARYDAGLRALGPEPAVDVEVDAPTPPAKVRPTPAQVDDASRVIAAAQQADGARKHAAQQAARAAEAVQRAEETLDRAAAEAKRCEALVAIVRRVPSEIAAEQASALGDLGPVSLRFPPPAHKNTPAIEVLVHGRPWWRASDGELILADLHLRAAIRRLAKMGAVPIFVDRAQSWSGAWPTAKVPGPVILLRTTTGDLEVRALPVAKAAA